MTVNFEAWAAERVAQAAAENAPEARAYCALDTLREALAAMTKRERDEIIGEMRALIADQYEREWLAYGAAFIRATTQES